MKKTFPSFDLGIDHLFPSEPGERRQKKEEQQRFACLEVSELDDLVEGAQVKQTLHCVSSLHNCLEFFQTPSCLDEAIRT